MTNPALAADYFLRAEKRISALRALMTEESWADVVREAQTVVELALKALLREHNVEVPRIHDVSGILLAETDRLPAPLRPRIPELAEISRELRRDREMAMYGAEDLTPSEFYKKPDAEKALRQAELVIRLVKPQIQIKAR